jgi:hypothetical protein
MTAIRFGVLRAAHIARRAHIPAAARATNAESVALCSRESSRAREWVSRLDVPKAYGSYAELLADPDIDSQMQLEHLADCILDDRPPMLTLDDARGNTAALVALKRAAQDGIQIALT